MLKNELNQQGSAVKDVKQGNGFDAELTSTSDMNGLAFDDEHPHLSVITMIAPSPDWFSGVNGYDMRDEESDTWYSNIILDLFPWDAGTDRGNAYTSANRDQNGGTIEILDIKTIPDNGIFAAPGGRTVVPVARLQCTLQGAAAPQCPREIAESCSKSKQCCPGNKCIGDRGEKQCLPCHQRKESCERNRDCCKGLKCRKGRCKNKRKE